MPGPEAQGRASRFPGWQAAITDLETNAVPIIARCAARFLRAGRRSANERVRATSVRCPVL